MLHMPGDSLYLNTKSITQHTYDAIVVGSGISGDGRPRNFCEKDYIPCVEKRAECGTYQGLHRY